MIGARSTKAGGLIQTLRDPRSNLKCQSSLAAAARPGERDEPVLGQQLFELRQFPLAADEGRQLRREDAGVRSRGRLRGNR